MTSRSATRRAAAAAGTTAARRRPRARRGRAARSWRSVVIAVVAVLVLAGLYTVYRTSTDPAPVTGTTASGSSGYPYQVGAPGVGQPAPAFRLAATTGAPVDLDGLRAGGGVLLYFQEGLMCQPCWEQITDLERNTTALKAAGIDQVVSITTDPIDLIRRKVTDMALSTVVLSDPDLAVSKTYHANEYGMMGTSRDGHTFILVKPDGSIGWRADYGGAPKYTMFLPTSAILTDLRADTGTTTP